MNGSDPSSTQRREVGDAGVETDDKHGRGHEPS